MQALMLAVVALGHYVSFSVLDDFLKNKSFFLFRRPH